MWPVKFTGLDPQIERRQIYAFFQPFGEIVRLFVKEDKSSATIYFNNSDSSGKAAAAIRQPNKHNFCIEELDGGTQRDNTQSTNLKPMEEFSAETTNMYDIHGHEIPTLSGDDGQMYVAVNDLLHSGFRLYTSKPSKLVYTTHIQEYIRSYLKIQMYKFACKYNCHINEEDKTRIISNLSDNISDEKTQNNSSIDELTINTPLRRPKDVNTCCPFLIKDSSVAAGVREATVNTQDVKKGEEVKSMNGFVRKNHTKDPQTPQRHLTDSKTNNNPPGNKITCEKKRIEQNTSSNIHHNKAKTINIDKRKSCDETLSQISTGSDFKRLWRSISAPINTQLQIYVSHVLGNNSKIVFVHLSANGEALERRNRDIMTEVAGGINITPYEGLICAVMYKSKWKRALIRSSDPLTILLIDYGTTPKLPINTIFRDLSEPLQNEPSLCIRACKSNESTITFEKYTTYEATVTKIYDDGTHIFQIHSKVSNDVMPKKQFSKAAFNSTDFDSMDLIPSGTNLANTTTSKTATSTPKHPQPPPKRQPTPPTSMDIHHNHPSILDKLRDGMQVMVEFHFETYVQDKSVVAFICILNWNDEEMEEIEKLTNITSGHISTYENKSSINIGDVVAVQSTTGEKEYFRCIVCNINKSLYSVAKVDVGTVEDVSAEDIKKLDEELKNVPYLSCICEYSDLEDLKDADLTFNVNSKKQLSQDGPTCKIRGMSVKPWDPLITHGPNAGVTKIDRLESAPIAWADFCGVEMRAKVLNMMALRVGDVVRIISVDLVSGMFFCQTREMFAYYNKEILENIRGAAGKEFTSLESPKEQQLVIVRINAILYRAVIYRTNINQSFYVRMIDIGGFANVPCADILRMGAAFAQKQDSCAQVTLEGLSGQLDEAAALYINACVQKKEKFVITKINDSNLVSMNDNNGYNLLNKLNSINKPPGFWFKNLKYLNIPTGVSTLIFSYANIQNGDVYFTVNDVGLRGRFAELLSEMPKYCESAKKYHPSKGEICYAFCLDDWCRAHVLSADKEADNYYVFFMDFGNCEKISSQLIRSLPDESYGTLPPLCNKFIIRDLKETYGEELPPSIGLKLEETLIMGSEYEVNVLRLVENNTYEAYIPKITGLFTNEFDDF